MNRPASAKFYIRTLILYSLIPPSVLVMALVLFDPYQVIRPQFGMRNFLANLAWGMPAIGLLWIKVWLPILVTGTAFSTLLLLIRRHQRKAKILIALVLGGLLGLLLCLSLNNDFMNWRDIPLGSIVPWAYAAAGAVGGVTVISLTPDDEQRNFN